MSHKLYSTGLFFEDHRGWAKLHGSLIYLFRPPELDGIEPLEIDYVPEVGRKTIVLSKKSPRYDMSRADIAAADKFLLTLLGANHAHRP